METMTRTGMDRDQDRREMGLREGVGHMVSQTWHLFKDGYMFLMIFLLLSVIARFNLSLIRDDRLDKLS